MPTIPRHRHPRIPVCCLPFLAQNPRCVLGSKPQDWRRAWNGLWCWMLVSLFFPSLWHFAERSSRFTFRPLVSPLPLFFSFFSFADINIVTEILGDYFDYGTMLAGANASHSVIFLPLMQFDNRNAERINVVMSTCRYILSLPLTVARYYRVYDDINGICGADCSLLMTWEPLIRVGNAILLNVR